jgi:tetracycline 7-halogenase / FADH2 O2-dependent halogenase
VTERFDVAIVGSGFAGSILARSLAGRGLRVALLERGRHPRFALGESSTPLAAIALERLASRYGLADLRALAAYGRWLRELPALRRGLKRGFTFLEHRAGQRLGPPPDDPRLAAGRLLVAASPNDEVADSHWLRSDVDAHLVERAIAEGVDYRDGVELRAAAEEPDGVRLSGLRNGRPLGLAAGFVVDASGPGRFLARHLPIPEAPGPARIESSLLYGHFEGIVPLAEAAPDLGPPGPYPDERAAVHHLIEEGWMYLLPFDDGLVSAGIELPSRPPGWAAAPPGPEGGFREGAARDPEAAFHRIAARYPTLAAQLGRARAVEPVRFVPRLQYRLSAAAGRRWLLLPGSFAATGPLFSTGIAWSLVAVERAAHLLEGGAPAPAGRERYGALLAQEADWIERLVAGALRLGRRFEHFAAWSLLYFAAASFAEASQRLIDRDGEGDEPWCWGPFLGAGDPVWTGALAEAERRIAAAGEGGGRELQLRAGPEGEDSGAAFGRWVLGAIAPRDVCGFDLPERRGLHPVDLETLVARAGRLGLDPGAVRAALPRLRGAPLRDRGTIRP